MTALIIVDPQNDFCDGGSLAVPNSLTIFPVINRLKRLSVFDRVYITKDWHPEGHISFSSTHNEPPFTKKYIHNTLYTLWPIHCIQHTKGSQIHPLLNIDRTEITVHKGMHLNEESYSGFGTEENPTELCKLLKESNISDVVVVGLAFDFCVGATALDAKRNGFNVYVVDEASREVKKAGKEAMIKGMTSVGIQIVNEAYFD